MVLKKAGKHISGVFAWFQRVFILFCVWGVIFSVATIGRLSVGFDYDDALSFSTPAFQKAQAVFPAVLRGSAAYWEKVNTSYDLERPKVFPYALAWLFRLIGFKVCVITSRPDIETQGLVKDWRHLIHPANFIFAGSDANKHVYIQKENCLLYFGSSDADIEQARLAHAYPVRVKRDKHSLFKADYHPKALREVVLPLSRYSL